VGDVASQVSLPAPPAKDGWEPVPNDDALAARFGGTKANAVPTPSETIRSRKQFGNAHVLAFADVCRSLPYCLDTIKRVDFPDRLSVTGLAADSQEYFAVAIADGRKGYIEKKYVELDKGCHVDAFSDFRMLCDGSRSNATDKSR
jgi:hypothetical protein